MLNAIPLLLAREILCSSFQPRRFMDIYKGFRSESVLLTCEFKIWRLAYFTLVSLLYLAI